ncbi:MAG TPA: ankyrin repeat domain-containing protein [Acetobacteraceae bacterium]|nr:ankyrin repeat domain-containing protein [Acetobacteraceae bacterium]
MDPDLPIAITPSAAGRRSSLVAGCLLSGMIAGMLAGCSRPEPPKEAGAAPAAAAPSAAPAAPDAEPVSLPEPDPAAAMRQAFVGPCRLDPPGPGPGPAPSADDPQGTTEAEADLAQSIREESWADVRVGLYLGVDLPPDLAPSVRRRVRQEELVVELHEAAYLGDVSEIRRLLKLGADPNRAIAWANAATPLAMAAACNHADAVRALVAGGAKVDQTFAWWWPPRAAYTGSTALLFASLTGSVDAARVLIELGADPNRRTMVDADLDPKTPPRPWSVLEAAESEAMERLIRRAGGTAAPAQAKVKS